MVIFVLSIGYSNGNNLTNENITDLIKNVTIPRIKEKISGMGVVGVDEPFSSIKFNISIISPKIESKIYEELEKKNKTRVVVILKEDWAVEEKLGKKEGFKLIKKKIKEKQNKVLSKLMENFELKNRYKTINAFSGVVTKTGLTILEHSPLVERVYLDRKAYASLSESIPLIEADKVWDLGYAGRGAVCITDTGVDYTHADLGDPSCSISQTINGNIESYLVESPHPYTNYYDNTWMINKPGYSNIAVHFDRIDVEEGYDFVYLYNAQGNFVQVFTGSYSDIWSISIPGDTIKVRLKADYSITDWGFKIDQVLNGTIDSSWSNCGQVIGGYDFVNNDYDPMDGDGHGTHCAGIVTSQDETYKGVSPGTNIVAAKVLDDSGSGWFSNVAAGVDWCIDNKDNYNINTISMSLGDGGEYNNPSTDCDPYATAIAINTAFEQGIFVVVASGNDAHENGISYPACASNATSVGSVYDADVGKITWGGAPPTCTDKTTSPDQIVCHTNRDEILDLLAPGALITSTVPGGYAEYGGTSMATPHVAGVASLMLDANNTLTPPQIRDILKNTGVSIYDSETGLTFPRVNASAAIDYVSPLTEVISITLVGFPVDFGDLEPNTANSPAIGNTNDSYVIKIDSVTTVNVDIYKKGDNFSSSAFTLDIENVIYDDDKVLEGGSDTTNPETILTSTYDTTPYFSNLSAGTNKNIYYWISIPENQQAGDYNTTFYIKAVETGTSP
jgi:subtilisin family serine protease